MKRFLLVLGALAASSGCTLLLPTEDIIVPCVIDDDCEEGFSCQQNACLPLDEQVEEEEEEEEE